MRQHNCKLLPLMALLVLSVATPTLGRRVRVSRPVAPVAVEDQEPRAQQVQYYTAEEAAAAERAGGQLVLVNDDAYQGLYGRQALERQSIGRQSDVAIDTYRPRSGQVLPASKPSARVKEAPRAPPVQTLSNYNKVNDDGSFTFGYEAADGSFKEETRGTDCVVRGKYGYVDPDGNKREFTYVSGNPCDPNAAKEEEEEEKINGALEDSEEENVPKGPIRPLRPRPIAAARPTTTVFQNNYVQDEDNVDAGPQQVLYRTTPRVVTPRPTAAYQPQQVATPRPTVRAQPAVRITPRPYSASTTVRSQLPATTYRPTLLASPTPAPLPGVIYSNSAQPTSSPHAATAAVDFDETLRQFQLEHNVLSTPRSVAQRPLAIPRPQQEHLAAAKPTGNALYETQLVYDPASGQYQTVFYQNIPQNDISQRHRLQPFGSQPSQQQLIQQQRQQQIAQQQQAALQQQRQQLPQQQAYQQQQANVLQQSQALFAQQQQQQQRQRALALQQQQQQPAAAAQQGRFTQFQASSQRYPLQQQYYQQQALQKEPSRQYYYVSPSENREGIAHGQIDAFLRTHNIAY